MINWLRSAIAAVLGRGVTPQTYRAANSERSRRSAHTRADRDRARRLRSLNLLRADIARERGADIK